MGALLGKLDNLLEDNSEQQLEDEVGTSTLIKEMDLLPVSCSK